MSEFLEAKSQLDKLHVELTTFVKKSEEEIKANGVACAETKTAIDKIAGECTDIGERLFKLEKARQRLDFSDDDSAGSQFVKSDAFKRLATEGAGRARLNVKNIINSTGQNQPLVPADRLPGIVAPADRILTVRNLLMVGRTSSNLIEFAKENVFTNSAGVQSGGSPLAFENVAKPESNLTFTLSNVPVVTLAHFIRASKQVLADAPQLQSYIDQRLSYGLKLEEEDQLLNGDGTNGNIGGLLKAGNFTAFNRGASGDTKIDTLRKGTTQVALSEYRASGIVINPEDWEEIELLKDNENRYIFAQPQSAASPTMWGLPVVATQAIAAGTFLVGAFNMGAQIWDREDATVMVSTEDGDNFTKNMVTILAEERIALTVYRPTAMVSGTF
jgi:HK97 family phage major capsid protein